MAQPAIARHSPPRAVRHSVSTSTTRKPATNRSRHHPGSPLRPTQRAVSAGRLCVAISCCCSPSAPRKPKACVPKPTTATTASSKSTPSALAATCARSRHALGASTTNGSTSPAEAFTPIPTTSRAAVARRSVGFIETGSAGFIETGMPPPRARGMPVLRAASASAPARTSSTSVSLCAPPTASSSSTGFKPTNTAATLGERPIMRAALAVRATAARLLVTATSLSAHRPPPSPSEASG